MKKSCHKFLSFLFIGLSLLCASCGGGDTPSGELKVTLSATQKTMNVDDTFVLSATIEGVELNTVRCYFDSDDIFVCNVKTNPETPFQTTITSYKAGTTDVNVTLYTYKDNTFLYSGKCSVTVESTEPEIHINFNNKKETVFLGESTSKALDVTYTQGITPTFISSDINVATVNSSGTVSALKAGLVTITASYDNVSDTCSVWVVPGKSTGTNLAAQSAKADRTIKETFRYWTVSGVAEYNPYIDDLGYIHLNVTTAGDKKNYWIRYVCSDEQVSHDVSIDYYIRNYSTDTNVRVTTNGGTYTTKSIISASIGSYTGTYIQQTSECFQIKFIYPCEIVLKVSVSK